MAYLYIVKLVYIEHGSTQFPDQSERARDVLPVSTRLEVLHYVSDKTLSLSALDQRLSYALCIPLRELPCM